MLEQVERIRGDRFKRWSVYAAAPFLYLAIALRAPSLLLVPALLSVALWKAMAYGIVERHDTPDDPDLY